MPPDGFARHPASDGGLSERLGALLSRRDAAGLRFGFACDKSHTNAMGWIHGGLLMTFADQVLGLTVQDALNSDNVATISLNCDFVSGVRPGDWIEGQARILRTTKSLVFVEGTIWLKEAIVLNANGIWYRRPDAGDGQPSGDRTS